MRGLGRDERRVVAAAVDDCISGLAAGALALALIRRRSAKVKLTPPKRVFKLCVESELNLFRKSGQIESSLDTADGFIHLSDRTSVPKVAAMFFSDAKDLWLLEIDAEKFEGNVQWLVGVMGDEPPSQGALGEADTSVHYLIADGCVHGTSRPSHESLATIRSLLNSSAHNMLAHPFAHLASAVYGTGGVKMAACLQVAHVPLGKDGKHELPAWASLGR